MKILGALVVVALLASGCSAAEPAPSLGEPDPDATTVEVVDFAYAPEQLEIQTGDTVTWVNRDDIAHTVTSGRAKKQGVPGVSENRDAAPDGVFDSGTMELDDTFDFTFDQAGTFTYFCAIHAGMSARVVVS
ncbi:MAG: plastocyanin/azurin family copper-binding protein [Actinomycetota bacterium]